MQFLKKHYEKILLGSLLTIFIILLCFQFLLWQQGQQIKIDSIVGFRPPPPNYTSVDFESQNSPFNVLANLSEVPRWEKSMQRNPRSKVFTDFLLPYEMALCPYCRKMIPAIDFPETNSYKEGQCSLCRHILRAPLRNKVSNEALDSDNDGIPDKEEQALGMNANDETDAVADFDADGFTNYEEFVAGTKIREAKSRPPYHHKLSVLNISKTVLPITLKQIEFKNRDDKKTATAQIEITRGRNKRSYFKKLGDTFTCSAGTFEIVDIIAKTEMETLRGIKAQQQKDASYIIIRKRDSKDLIEAHLREKVTEPKEKITIKNGILPKNQEQEYYIGDTLSIGDNRTGIDKYVFVAADPQKKVAVLKSEKDGKTYEIGVKSQMQLLIEQKKTAESTKKAMAKDKK